MHDRLVIKFAGPSGKGINILGGILSKSIKSSGFFNFAYREYPSLIKGGAASYQIDIAEDEISSSFKKCNILALLTNDVKSRYIKNIREHGILIHGENKLILTDEERQYIEANNINTISLDTMKIALDAGGLEIMANMVLLGFIWKLLSLDIKPLEETVKETFKDKNIDIDCEIDCLMAGYSSKLVEDKFLKPIKLKSRKKLNKALSITGNQGVALGAVSAGCRAYYAYPMTPSTSIFKFLGDTYKETGILVKQAESEITAVQMALGSMNMGTRALTATSGGGFDLMSETVSCSGMAEVPLVIVLAQRAGASTGVPTWTGASDLSLAINAGHGEFPRCVMTVSNPKDAYDLIQQAFNVAEVYQMPVILLTEKQIAESIFTVEKLSKPQKIERGLRIGLNRYEITESGISPRWMPSEKNPPFLVNSDEHKPTGESTENSEDIIEMSDKRMRKMQILKDNLSEPEYFGSRNPEVVFVCYGSTANTVKDILKQKPDIGCLQYSYIYPLKTKRLTDLKESGKRLVLIENNQTGEFGKLVKEESGIEITKKLLKYDGRPFFVEDILDFLGK